MNVFDHPQYREHEQVVFCRDVDADLFAIIAIHNSSLGPAAGGCRMLPYESHDAALTDVLKLSHAMTIKNSLSGLPLGGGKSVIIGDPEDSGTCNKLSAFARYVNDLGGRYWTSEDVGVGVEAVEVLARHTKFVFGSGDGDPAPATALGVLHAMRAAVRHTLGHEDISQLRIAVQGVGRVGFELCRLLHSLGCMNIVVADRNPLALKRLRKAFAASEVDPSLLLTQKVDVVVPCALGGVLNAETVKDIKAPIVCGSANNQLSDASVEGLLAERGITFVPDSVSSAGGILQASLNIPDVRKRVSVDRKVERIYTTTLEILRTAQREGSFPSAVAERLAMRRLTA